jgi:hypothetical protein
MKNSFYFFSLLVFSLMLMSAGSAFAAESLRVEVLVFSGRPNPAFTITDPVVIHEILSQANSLPAHPSVTAKDAGEKSILGYRGIVVSNVSATSSDVKSLVVNRSKIQLNRKGLAPSKAGTVSEARLDNGSALENRLLGLARSKGVIDDRLFARLQKTK